jgi:excisionase family DNA binding protein
LTRSKRDLGRKKFMGARAANSPWMNAREAALYLRVAHRTILQWAKEGRIHAHRLSGTARVTWRFKAVELDAMMAAPSAAENGEFNAAK